MQSPSSHQKVLYGVTSPEKCWNCDVTHKLGIHCQWLKVKRNRLQNPHVHSEWYIHKLSAIPFITHLTAGDRVHILNLNHYWSHPATCISGKEYIKTCTEASASQSCFLNFAQVITAQNKTKLTVQMSTPTFETWTSFTRRCVLNNFSSTIQYMYFAIHFYIQYMVLF